MARQRRDTTNLTGLRTGVYLRVSRADKCKHCRGTGNAGDGACGKCEGSGFEGGAERSTDTQMRIFEEWAGRSGVIHADTYADPDMSASRFASKKNRPEFERMTADLQAGKLDILWFWEISRQQRRLDVFADLRNLCRERGVLWVMRDRVADPSDSKDMLLAGIQSMMAEDESEKLSGRVFDGKESSALKGKRAGRFPYGYKRGKYDPVTETFGPDEPDVLDGAGLAVEDSPAYVVREIFDRIKGGESVTSIRKNLNDRGLKTKTGAPWANSTLRYVAMNPAYAGLRARHIGHGAGLSARAAAILPGVETKWPPLIPAETFWAVYRILSDPSRKTTKPHRPGGRLLAGVASCGECGCKLTTRLRAPLQRQRADIYTCRENGCTGIYVPDLDKFAERVMVTWLSDPATAEALQRGGDQAAVALARADAEKARAELAEWVKLAGSGDISAGAYSAAEKRLRGRIADAEQREHEASVPPVLAGRTGPAAAAGWEALSIPVRRQMIAAVADIRLRRVGRHGNRLVPPAERVEWRWLLGPAADDDSAGLGDGLEQRVRDAAAARLAARRAKVMHLREEGWTPRMIADELGVSLSTVKKDIAGARAILSHG